MAHADKNHGKNPDPGHGPGTQEKGDVVGRPTPPDLPPFPTGGPGADPRQRAGLGPRPKDRGEDPHYTPYICLDHDDLLAPTGVFYLSPDIWVVSSLGKNLPVEGEPNKVFARVHNRGLMDAANVNVRFYWADPSAAITDASVHPIGGSTAAATKTGVFIPASVVPGQDSSAVVECPSPWLPVHRAHECLVVKAWCPGFDLPVPPYEPVLDAVSDRHSAQHNVNVQLLPAGSAYELEIAVANISRFAQTVRVEVRALGFDRIGATLKMLGVPLPHRPSAMRQGLPMHIRLADERVFQHQGDAAFARLLLNADEAAARGEKPVCRQHTGLIAEAGAAFAPWERRQLKLAARVPADAKPGQVYGFEVTQLLGDLVTGGYIGLLVASGR